MKQTVCFFLVLLLTGCSSLPQELTSSQAVVITEYSAFSTVAESNRESDVRLGGVIARIDNLTTTTRIEVVNLPISSSGKPDIAQEPNGRFVVYFDGFIDPVTYGKGRLITVLGQSNGIEKATVGDYLYSFPIITGVGIHLWQVQEYVVTNDFNMNYMPCTGSRCLHQRSRLETHRGKVVQEVQ
ncbi:Slp family lipoprotein [Aliivibrio finisterrensis]|uniref:Slp family lipoprotein n=1 Tax=Aliivibrio finisterrensis TaxID=511998 RepID=UPI001021AA62|nr:Slp family lipoprotein [Aliivibrio finisterrensis]RYU67342.1 Slp family lipoprotein [Aliivibrio finisterrensis]RYU70712.1 Slp family lipoprotein [Aliivibrio finisterrensis]RYU73905.1 Slp family lipoprotein [Aliivibrio finisterrensis]